MEEKQGYSALAKQKTRAWGGRFMAYYGVDLKNSISIKRIYSIHYFEYMSNFSFAGESHDFWEFIFVDKGQVGAANSLAQRPFLL